MLVKLVYMVFAGVSLDAESTPIAVPELYRRQSYCGGCWRKYALQCLFHRPPSVGRLTQGLKYCITDLHRMLSVDDSEKLTIPLAIYVSKDEPLNEVR